MPVRYHDLAVVFVGDLKIYEQFMKRADGSLHAPSEVGTGFRGMSTNTWKEFRMVPGMEIILCKMILNRKADHQNCVARYKTPKVAKA